MSRNGEEENINRDRRSVMEGTEEVCDRCGQRIIRDTRGIDKGKNNEVKQETQYPPVKTMLEVVHEHSKRFKLPIDY